MITVEKGSLVVKSLFVHQQTRLLLTKISLLVIRYGATGGEAYIAGVAGARFCVRN